MSREFDILSAGLNVPMGRRAASPGQVLQDIKARLDAYVTTQKPTRPHMTPSMFLRPEVALDDRPSRGSARSPACPDVLSAASADIQTLDLRLEALQRFLKSAKLGMT